MGRYYSGDIQGKFRFALQSSDAASRFGGEEFYPQFIEYYFGEEHLDAVNEEINNIQESLGDKIKVIEDFFKINKSYNEETLNGLGVTNKELKDYADLGMGIKIRDCIEGSGSCTFQAEL